MKDKKVKKPALTRDYLLRATYSYLQKFATTEKNLRDVLIRKARRRLPVDDDGLLYAEAAVWIDDIVQKAVDRKLVDDHQFALSRAASLARSGNSRQKIIQKLLARGVRADMVEEVMETLAEQHPDMDFIAAVRYARKRRFGAFRADHAGPEFKEKHRAGMCRAGFSFTTADRVLKMSYAELEDVLYQRE